MQFERVPFGSLFCCPQKNGLTRPKRVRGSGVPMVNMGELFAYPRIRNIEMDLVPVSVNETDYILQAGDLLFARQSLVREGAGQCSIFLGNSAPTVFESHLIRCRLDPARAVPEFFFYYFWSPEGRRSMDSIVESGAGASGIRGSDLVRLEVPVPNRSHQIAVAECLAVIDDRIDLLRETNATLESIARAIFVNWFVDFDPVHAKSAGLEVGALCASTASLFPAKLTSSSNGPIPDGWRWGRLGDVCTNPRTQVKPRGIPSSTRYIGLEHMPRKSIALRKAGTAEGLESSKFWFERDDVLFGKLRPYFHKVGLAPFPGVCSTDILVLRPTSPLWLGFVAMHASSDELVAHTTQLSNGAKMPRTSWQDLADFAVVIPSDGVAQAFTDFVNPLFRRIYANIETEKLLADLRDTMLPRLISGKLQLPELKDELREIIA